MPENARTVENLNEMGIAAEVTESVEAAAAEADVISCATLSQTPVLQGAWPHPGQHIDLIGSFTPTMREADDAVLTRATVYVDTMDVAAATSRPCWNWCSSKATFALRSRTCAKGICPRASRQRKYLFGVGTAIEDLSDAILAYRSTS